jgi:parallel beta-helix repeat protein
VTPNHNAINIESNLEFNSTNGVVGGSGTFGSPYLIANWIISVITSDGIYINNTNVYAIIQNCTVINGGGLFDGIYLNNASNIIVENNTVTNNWHGIEMDASSNNTFTNNTVLVSSFSGIDLEGSSNNTISYNTASWQTNGTGIDLGIRYEEPDYNNTVANNTATEDYEGVYVAYSNFNFIIGNNLSSDILGVYLAFSNNNTFASNIGTNNTDGMEFDMTDLHNIVVDSNFSSSGSGIWMGSNAEYNLVWDNNLFNNSLYQAFDNSIVGNQWYYNNTGNYWGDYLIRYPNATNDGRVWNTSYLINGSIGDRDLYPLVEPFGFSSVVSTPLNITHPNNQQITSGTTGNKITWNITDTNTYNPTYVIYRNGTFIQNETWISGAPVIFSIDGLPIGSYNFSIIATDGFGETIQDDVIVTVLSSSTSSTTTTTTTTSTSSSNSSSSNSTTSSSTPPSVSGYETILMLGIGILMVVIEIRHIRKQKHHCSL